MRGIKANLLRAFLAVIVGLSFCTVVLLAINSLVVRQYKDISDTLIAEYRLVDSLSGLFNAYNTRVISTDANDERADAELRKTKEQVAVLTAFLDAAIKDQRSKVSYLGLKNSIEAVIATVDESLRDISSGDVHDFTKAYYESNRQYQFVRENGTTLIFDELKYASSILDAMNRTYLWSQVFGLVTLLLIILGCVAYVVSFSSRMTDPLRRLQQMALQIAAGRRDTKVDKDILARNDELGSLAQSFQIMTDELAKANQREVESQRQIKKRADDLEQMNKLMVGRELKMIQMKKELDGKKP